MKTLTFQLTSVLVLFAVFLGGCAKKDGPQTTLNRDSDGKDLASSTSGFNQGDEFSAPGTPVRGDFGDEDLLAPRDSALEGFSDPLNTIRPFGPVLFGFDQYNLTAEERPKLQEISEFMKDNPQARLLVEGYCDWKGTPEYNKSLGDRRATTVKDYLIELGGDSNRIETVSIGDESAIPNADTTQARLDRRAAFVVTKGS
ncbi:MAG: OmpA family protein [Opitutae bacterium]|nr:OmpA family protein [Opitutae bacterium]